MQAILAMLALSMGLGFDPERAVATPPAIEVYITARNIPTYPYADHLEMHHSSAYNVDYPWWNWSQDGSSQPVLAPQDYSAIVVRNPWLRLTFLPELGGQLYGVTVKSSGEELLHQNPLIKLTLSIDGGDPTILSWRATAIGRQRLYLPLAVKALIA